MTPWIIRIIIIFAFLVTLKGICVASTELGNNFVPFNVGKAGATASIEINVSWMTSRYPREVALMINPPKGWKDKNGNDVIPKYNQLMKSLTGLVVFPSPGNIRPVGHKGVNLQVTWTKKMTGKIIRVRNVYADNYHGRVSAGYGNAFSLDWMLLPPGDYVVFVKALDNDARFDGTFVTGICAGFTLK